MRSDPVMGKLRRPEVFLRLPPFYSKTQNNFLRHKTTGQRVGSMFSAEARANGSYKDRKIDADPEPNFHSGNPDFVNSDRCGETIQLPWMHFTRRNRNEVCRNHGAVCRAA